MDVILRDILGPLLRHLVVRENGLDRTLGNACPAVDAFLGVDVILVLALVDAVDGTDLDALGLVVVPDAHSPKNQFLVEGVQAAVGEKFPITGGSVNKNAGQTFVYFRGKMLEDAAVALMLSGDFSVSLTGRKAKDNDLVISSAKDGAAEALKAAEAGLKLPEVAKNSYFVQLKLDRADALYESEETRAQALDKLSKFTPKIGYPDVWRNYDALRIRADDLFEATVISS